MAIERLLKLFRRAVRICINCFRVAGDMGWGRVAAVSPTFGGDKYKNDKTDSRERYSPTEKNESIPYLMYRPHNSKCLILKLHFPDCQLPTSSIYPCFLCSLFIILLNFPPNTKPTFNISDVV